MTGKTNPLNIFITGASNGIGNCLAEMAGKAGHNVLTTGRSGGMLVKDLSDEDAPKVLAKFARNADIAVLNAAIAPGVEVELQLTVNLTRQMQLALLLLKNNPNIKLAFVGSVISGAVIPSYPAYCAAKAGIAAFARALAAEFPGQILLYHPSGTQSKFMERSGVSSPGHLDSTAAVAGRLLTLIQKETYPWRRPATWKAWVIDWAAKLGLVLGPKPEPFDDGTTLVTGAGSGLGKALVSADPSAIGMDISGADVQGNILKDLPNLPRVDRLINCAGDTWTGPSTKMPYGKIEHLMEVNLLGPIKMEGTLRPKQTIQISSLSHQIGYPFAAVYAATKSAIATWGLCRGHLVVFPGPMNTPQAAAARLGGQPSKTISEPAFVAKSVLAGSKKGLKQLVPGQQNKILRIAGRLFPHITTAAFARDQLRRLSQ